MCFESIDALHESHENQSGLGIYFARKGQACNPGCTLIQRHAGIVLKNLWSSQR